MGVSEKYTSLILNGITCNKKGLLDQTWLSELNITDFEGAGQTPGKYWLDSLVNFIAEWLNDESFVYVDTSGSTGKPKNIRLDKNKMVHSALMTGKYFGFRPGQTALLCLPCDFIAGKMMVVRAMVWGLDLRIVAPSGDPLAMVDFQVDFAAMIPLQVDTALKNNSEKFSLLRKLIIGGGKVDELLLTKLNKLSTYCYATYGMTETITHVAIKKLNGPDQTRFFNGLPGIAFTLDKRGCLCIKAPALADQLIVTNDLVALRNENEFEWLGRIDNVINTGGVKVFPEVIEHKISHFISQRFFITSIPDNKLGNKVILIIEDNSWSSQKTDALKLGLKQVLSKFELPKKIYFLDAFAETPTKKIQRKRTKEKLFKFNF